MAQLTYTASDVAALVRRARTDPLGPAEVLALLDDLRRLHRERDAMLRVLDDLAPSWRQACCPPERSGHHDRRRGPERLLDIRLRTGPYGDGFGARPEGLSLDALLAQPHGVDLGALEPRLPGALRTASGRIELASPVLLADLDRLATTVVERAADELWLVNRRDLRSNNSWMHNLDVLTRGKDRCVLQVHPVDAAVRGLETGDLVQVTSGDGVIEVRAQVTDSVRPGVVSLPHGWGHDTSEARDSPWPLGVPAST